MSPYWRIPFIVAVLYLSAGYVGLSLLAIGLLFAFVRKLSARRKISISTTTTLAILSLSTWIFFPGFWLDQPAMVSGDVNSIAVTLSQRIATITVVLAIAAVVMSSRSHLVLFFFLGGSLILLAWTPLPGTYPPGISGWMSVFAGAYKFFILPISFAIFFEKRGLSIRDRCFAAPLILPFWSVGTVVPVTKGTDIKIYDESKVDFRSAGKLAIYTLIGFLVVVSFELIFYARPNLNLKHFQIVSPIESPIHMADLRDGFQRASIINDSPFERWTSLFLAFIAIYLKRALFFNSLVVVARVSGFALPSNFNNPWRARSLSQFYGSLIHYYNQVLMQLFFPMIKSAFGFLRFRIARVYLALFLAIGIGGYYVHFLRDFQTFFAGRGQTSILIALLDYSPTLIYFCSVALVCTLSALLTRAAKQNHTVSTANPLRTCYFVIVWSLIYSIYMATLHAKTDLATYANYMRGLLP